MILDCKESEIENTNQIVDGIFGFGLAALDESLGERGHDVSHQVVPQRRRLGLQQLELFFSNLLEFIILFEKESWISKFKTD